ncbi:hypothetical protein PGT21_026515 [Puccinia graminis f. sp. tritici]|nr:hypothetical protein PGT21_025131 [Puccinia graminis f. sp. tritici]KAA1108821.1 hypothetical protein PGT21_026515 [Puccinia graminis f. sp. tritici]KAA1122335.1 hypothetical protein PGTUg99_036771 [Puccinia graminis f. sp. tritici]KAA1129016.1 hypothetical protein PGTUg99_023630 [Puccinia graminis f. sp. tritici]
MVEIKNIQHAQVAEQLIQYCLKDTRKDKHYVNKEYKLSIDLGAVVKEDPVQLPNVPIAAQGPCSYVLANMGISFVVKDVLTSGPDEGKGIPQQGWNDP